VARLLSQLGDLDKEKVQDGGFVQIKYGFVYVGF
jgi:hypothetical protein